MRLSRRSSSHNGSVGLLFALLVVDTLGELGTGACEDRRRAEILTPLTLLVKAAALAHLGKFFVRYCRSRAQLKIQSPCDHISFSQCQFLGYLGR